jgi:hypothetical protein
LIVSEVEALLDYVRSYAAGLTGDQEEALRRQLQVEIDRHGRFNITKASGMISGVKH